MVARTASPIAPPIWIAVVETPETSPECFSLTPETAASVAGTNVIPRPALRMISGGGTPLREGLWGRRVARRDIPRAPGGAPAATGGGRPARAPCCETAGGAAGTATPTGADA